MESINNYDDRISELLDSTCSSENIIFFDIVAPINDVPPAKVVITTTLMISTSMIKI